MAGATTTLVLKHVKHRVQSQSNKGHNRFLQKRAFFFFFPPTVAYTPIIWMEARGSQQAEARKGFTWHNLNTFCAGGPDKHSTPPSTNRSRSQQKQMPKYSPLCSSTVLRGRRSGQQEEFDLTRTISLTKILSLAPTTCP